MIVGEMNKEKKSKLKVSPPTEEVERALRKMKEFERRKEQFVAAIRKNKN